MYRWLLAATALMIALAWTGPPAGPDKPANEVALQTNVKSTYQTTPDSDPESDRSAATANSSDPTADDNGSVSDGVELISNDVKPVSDDAALGLGGVNLVSDEAAPSSDGDKTISDEAAPRSDGVESTALDAEPGSDKIEPISNAAEPVADADNSRDGKQPDTFEARVEGWIRTLSGEAGFEQWANARWTRYPLGPGTHGWLILLHHDGREVGYLVVGATEDGSWMLSEYGAGPNPMFSLNTLYRSLVQHELIDSATDSFADWQTSAISPKRLYFSPLHAVWKVANENSWLYIDAKTGELLPLNDSSLAPLVASAEGGVASGSGETPEPAAAPESGKAPKPTGASEPSGTPEPTAGSLESADSWPSGRSNMIIRSVSWPAFDPFDHTGWITGQPDPFESEQQLIAALDGGATSYTFVANLYDRTVLAPFAVTGYHHWEDGAFIAVEQDGIRLIPYRVLSTYGGFHRQPGE